MKAKFDMYQRTHTEARATFYTYKDGHGRVIFIDRAGELIKDFRTWEEAFAYACENIHLVDRTLQVPPPLSDLT